MPGSACLALRAAFLVVGAGCLLFRVGHCLTAAACPSTSCLPTTIPALLPSCATPLSPLPPSCCSTTKIENKIALRCVQNADIHLQEAFVPDSDRLPGGCAGGWGAPRCHTPFAASRCSSHVAPALKPRQTFLKQPQQPQQPQQQSQQPQPVCNHPPLSCPCRRVELCGHQQGSGHLAHHGGLAASGAGHGGLRHVRPLPQPAPPVWRPAGSLPAHAGGWVQRAGWGWGQG